MTPAEHREGETRVGRELYLSHPIPDTYDGWKRQAEYLAAEYNKLADRWSEEHDRAEAAAGDKRVLVEAIERIARNHSLHDAGKIAQAALDSVQEGERSR